MASGRVDLGFGVANEPLELGLDLQTGGLDILTGYVVDDRLINGEGSFPATVLEFSDDLRGPDVRALRSFLDVRLAELADALPSDTDARWAADHLAAIVDAACLELDDSLGAWADALAQSTRRPGFTDHPDYLPRWRHLRWSCAEHAEFYEQALSNEAGGSDGDGPTS